jgi:hypothetical protein
MAFVRPASRAVQIPACPNPGLNSGRLTLFFGCERKDQCGARPPGLKQFAEE